MDHLKTKADDLGVGKLKTILVDLKKLSDVVSKEIVKKTVFKKLNEKVNNLENKKSDGFTLIQTNQCNTDEQNLEKKIGDVKNQISCISGVVTTTVLNTDIREVENKIPDTGLVTTTVLSSKIGKVESKIPDHSKYITTPKFNEFAGTIFHTKLKQTNLAINSDVNAVLQRGNKNK